MWSTAWAKWFSKLMNYHLKMMSCLTHFVMRRSKPCKVKNMNSNLESLCTRRSLRTRPNLKCRICLSIRNFKSKNRKSSLRNKAQNLCRNSHLTSNLNLSPLIPTQCKRHKSVKKKRPSFKDWPNLKSPKLKTNSLVLKAGKLNHKLATRG